MSHTSDCAVHNEPAMPAGPCDCAARPAAWIRLAKSDGRYAEIDVTPDGRLTFSGTLPPTDAAQVFLDELGGLLTERLGRNVGKPQQ